MNGASCLEMINTDIVPRMMELVNYNLLAGVLFPDTWWIQDGATAHRTNDVRNCLGSK